MNIRRIHQRNSLRPEERLKLRKQIEMLFRQGEAFSFYPLRVVYRFIACPDAAAPVRVGFSIPKKRCRQAQARNRIRRLLKEAWRTQKHDLYHTIPSGRQLHCFLIYNSSEILTFEQAKETISAVLKRLIQSAQSEHATHLHS